MNHCYLLDIFTLVITYILCVAKADFKCVTFCLTINLSHFGRDSDTLVVKSATEMTTQVISTTVSYISKASFQGQVFISTADVLRSEKKLDKGFFLFFNKLIAILHQQVEGFSNLPSNMEAKLLFNMLKDASIVVEVTRYEEGEQIDDEDVADEVTYFTEIKQLVLSKKGQQELQEQFLLSSMASFGLKKELISMLKAKAARMGGTVAQPDAAADDAHDDDAAADDAGIPAYIRKDVKRSSLSDDEKELRTEYLKAGNKLI